MSDASSTLRDGWYVQGRLRFRHLQMLLALDDSRHVGEAAQRLSTTQPAVSRMMAELETMVGTRLFERTSKGTYPTPHGASMIRHARWVLGDLDRMGREWAQASGLETETLEVGVNSSSAAFLMPHALLRFEQQVPGSNVRVREGSIEALLPDLYTRKLDLIVARLGEESQASELVRHVLYEEPMCICCAADHPLANQTPSWEDLSTYPWILPPQGSPVRIGLDRLFQPYGLQARSRIESASVTNNLVLMENSLALSVVPRSVASSYVQLHRLAVVDKALPPVFGPIGVIRHQSLEPTPAMKALLDCLRHEAHGLKERAG